MDRRNFLKSTSAIAFCHPLIHPFSGHQTYSQQFDQFGGWGKKNFYS
jgi:hypothetical protein